ncbi:hypothetical protein CALVIDRAFT_556864 [Calocera viscosa TUFC12733]|uniref:Uncharacterized protein n=1 Tax=Calocera viscosa (strain TUFC12733) TaxID=1330018 RepID=A0A167JIU6_CALVF|nr:hypothetical protein CALVIDRAFT_556864 [Calocera viscosa TUFC12733]
MAVLVVLVVLVVLTPSTEKNMGNSEQSSSLQYERLVAFLDRIDASFGPLGVMCSATALPFRVIVRARMLGWLVHIWTGMVALLARTGIIEGLTCGTLVGVADGVCCDVGRGTLNSTRERRFIGFAGRLAVVKQCAKPFQDGIQLVQHVTHAHSSIEDLFGLLPEVECMEQAMADGLGLLDVLGFGCGGWKVYRRGIVLLGQFWSGGALLSSSNRLAAKGTRLQQVPRTPPYPSTPLILPHFRAASSACWTCGCCARDWTRASWTNWRRANDVALPLSFLLAIIPARSNTSTLSHAAASLRGIANYTKQKPPPEREKRRVVTRLLQLLATSPGKGCISKKKSGQPNVGLAHELSAAGYTVHMQFPLLLILLVYVGALELSYQCFGKPVATRRNPLRSFSFPA